MNALIRIGLVLMFGVFATYLVAQTAALSSSEQEDLLFMLEEEKLARDVYIALDEKWGLQPFKNITNAEDRHSQFILKLVNDNRLPVPTSILENKIGEFDNPELQQLYIELKEWGFKSEVDALKVGAKIEEVDIQDLDNAIAQSENKSLLDVYTYLRRGSENHLRAFVRNLEFRDVDYDPVLLNKATYNKIIKGPGTMGKCCDEGNKSKANCGNGKKGKKEKGCCSKGKKATLDQ